MLESTVAAKLKIVDTWDESTAAEVEGIVAKAIRDGSLDATLDHTTKTLTSGTAVNIYRTGTPAEVFDRRINFTLNIHNDAVKAMRCVGPYSFAICIRSPLKLNSSLHSPSLHLLPCFFLVSYSWLL